MIFSRTVLCRHGLALCLFMGVATAFKAEAERKDAPVSIAWAVLTNQNGDWQCKHSPDIVVPALIKSGVRYLRVGGAAGPQLESGIPSEEVAPYFKKMREAGLKLGVVLYSQNKETSDERLIEKAIFLKQSGYYDWIMIDSIKPRPRMQWIVDEIHKAGWEEVMINASPWTKEREVSIPKGCWSYACLFGVLGREEKPYKGGCGIVESDRDYVRKINDNHPGALPIVKLEIPWQIETFKALSTTMQNQLLTEWSEGQKQFGYTMIYPLFTGTGKGDRGYYDSITAGTFAHQARLMRENNEIVAQERSTSR
jgi:hypothetical protein